MSQSYELTMLERKFVTLKEGSGEANTSDMSGNEESAVVYRRLYELKTTVAFREVVKFKKRTRYVEFFVFVSFPVVNSFFSRTSTCFFELYLKDAELLHMFYASINGRTFTVLPHDLNFL